MLKQGSIANMDGNSVVMIPVRTSVDWIWSVSIQRWGGGKRAGPGTTRRRRGG